MFSILCACFLFFPSDGATLPPQSPSHPLAANAAEVAQFWRVLAGCVAKNERGEGQRVDLLGCGLEESPEEGAALLKVRFDPIR